MSFLGVPQWLVPGPFQGDTPVTGPRSLPGGYPSPKWGGTPLQGTPLPGMGYLPAWSGHTGVPLSQVRMGGGGTPRQGTTSQRWVPLARSGWGGTPGWLYPQPGMAYPQPGMGYLPSPWIEQQTEYLLHNGRCASCVHAGGLSCLSVKFYREILSITTIIYQNMTCNLWFVECMWVNDHQTTLVGAIRGKKYSWKMR